MNRKISIDKKNKELYIEYKLNISDLQYL
ncbi:hypothetical protein CLOSBL3_11608 [Clostridiaceae bacterium BL-3]|nr:hypothetical protein CLOSBL3_11608 [Clostridiaceae bacterium BL-3]